MVLPFDYAILVSSGISFLAFFILQVIVFRMVHPEAVLRWIMNIFMIVSVLHLFVMNAFCRKIMSDKF